MTNFTSTVICGVLCCLNGCTNESPAIPSPNDVGKNLSGTPIRVEVSGTKLEVVTDEGERARVPRTQGETVVGDHLIVVDARGEATLVRTPKAVNTEIARLPVVYYRSDTREEVLLDGHHGNPIRHPETGIVCWLALYCKNPACSTAGEPFYYELPGQSLPVDSRAEAHTNTTSRALTPQRPPPCPHCQQLTLERYEPYEVTLRRQALQDELRAARAARRTNQ